MPDQTTKPAAARVPRLSIEAREAELELERAKARAASKAAERAQVIEKVKVAAGSREPLDQKLRIAIVAAAVFIVILTLLLGSAPVKIVACVMCLGMLQGLWRGASELVGIVASSLVAVIVAPPMGRALEGVTAGFTGNDGLLNRMVAVALVGLLIVIVGSVLVSVVAKRQLKKHPGWVRWNSIAGAGLGLIEGIILGMAILWTPLALEPIAATQLAEADAETASPVAEGIRSFAGRVRDSSLGKVAEATNPIEGSRLLSLANDFIAVARDEDAMEYFMGTPVMQELASLPSVNQARERIGADAELTGVLKDQGVSVEVLNQVLKSRTILEVFDQTTVVADLSPRAERLVAAIGEAKARIGLPRTPAAPPSRR
ncbi:MAG TPA: CvpA family protein [Phycisphaerales bacterium]|nr:CvpA family protein [Phycisphaerales bacterium]